jgi:hypothetical protein
VEMYSWAGLRVEAVTYMKKSVSYKTKLKACLHPDQL